MKKERRWKRRVIERTLKSWQSENSACCSNSAPAHLWMSHFTSPDQNPHPHQDTYSQGGYVCHILEVFTFLFMNPRKNFEKAMTLSYVFKLMTEIIFLKLKFIPRQNLLAQSLLETCFRYIFTQTWELRFSFSVYGNCQCKKNPNL